MSKVIAEAPRRFLFVVPPLTGHINPTVPLGRALSERGHEVAWTGYRSYVAPLLDRGARLFPLGDELPDDIAEAIRAKSEGLRGVMALEFLWKELLHPLAVAMVPGVEEAVEVFRPDVLVVDQQAFAGGVVARRRSLPWVTSATTSAELVDPFVLMPKVGEWVRDHLVDLQVEVGVDPGKASSMTDLRFSEFLVLAYTTEALAGPPIGLPAGSGPVAMIGPSLPQAVPGQSSIAWEELEGFKARVFVSLGTVNRDAGSKFLAMTIAALGQLDMAAVVVADRDRLAEAGCLELPPGIVVKPSVDQLEVLGRVDAVVCHGGHNTVCESLAHGLPMVVAPIRDDQPIIADQVVRCGAGIRARYGRSRVADLVEAIGQVVGTDSYRSSAAAVQKSFAEAGGLPEAVSRLETLAGQSA